MRAVGKGTETGYCKPLSGKIMGTDHTNNDTEILNTEVIIKPLVGSTPTPYYKLAIRWPVL